MSGVVSIESGSEQDLLAAVATVGPIAVAVDASSNGFRVINFNHYQLLHVCTKAQAISYHTNYYL